MKKIIVIFLINLMLVGSAVVGTDGEDSLSKKSGKELISNSFPIWFNFNVRSFLSMSSSILIDFEEIIDGKTKIK